MFFDYVHFEEFFTIVFKMRTVLRKHIEAILLLLFLAAMTPGCCTGTLVKKSKQKTEDILYPFAVYEKTNDINYVFEGNLRKNLPAPSGIPNHSEPPIHAYLITSKTNFATPYYTDNGVYMLPERRSDLTKHLRVENQLPPNYKKLADLHQNCAGLKIQEHHTNRWILIFLPFSVTVDVATAPIQIPLIVLFNSGLGRGP